MRQIFRVYHSMPLLGVFVREFAAPFDTRTLKCGAARIEYNFNSLTSVPLGLWLRQQRVRRCTYSSSESVVAFDPVSALLLPSPLFPACASFA